MEKHCNRCGTLKAFEDFHRNSASSDGRRPECKECTAARRKRWYEANREREIARVKAWQQANPDRVRAKAAEYRATGQRQANDRRSYLKRKFGITPEQYDAMLEAQGGVCAVCGRTPRNDISLHVDHDHETGAVRGLLCFSDNSALGNLKEDQQRIRKLLTYLDDHDPEVRELAELTRRRLAELIA